MSEMTIWCPSCDRRLRCSATMLGKQTTCPACKHAFVVQDENQTYGFAPAEGPTSDSDGTLKGKANEGDRGPAGQPLGEDANCCPSCSGAMLPDAVLCVNCGFDRRTGTRIETQTEVASPHAHDGEVAHAGASSGGCAVVGGGHLSGMSVFIIAWGILGGAWTLLTIARRGFSGFHLTQLGVDAAGPLLFLGVCVLWYRLSRRRVPRKMGATAIGIALFVCGTVALIKAAHATLLIRYVIHDLPTSVLIYCFVTSAVLGAAWLLTFSRRPVLSSSSLHTCGNCGRPIAPRAMVCVECGCNQLTGDVAGSDVGRSRRRKPDTLVVGKCLFCSRSLAAGEDLCTHCGHSQHDLQGVLAELEVEAETRARKELAACYGGVSLVAGACFIQAGHYPGAAALGAAVALCGALLTHFIFATRIVGPLSPAALRDKLHRELSSASSVLAHFALWLAVIPVLNVLGTILGITALVRINQSRGRIYGRRRAIAATAISLWFYPVMLAVYADMT